MSENLLTLEQLRATFAALSADAVPRPDCPVPDTIWEALHGGLPDRATAAVVEHTSRCPACAEAWRLAHEMAGGRVARAGKAAHMGMFRAPPIGVWTGLAAAALVSFLAAIRIFMPPAGEGPEVTRAGAETEIRALVSETAPLPRDACILKWSPPADGTRYFIRVGLQDLTPIAWARNLEKPEYRIPIEYLEKVPAGAIIVWNVEAELPDGRRITSQAFMNRIE